MSVTKALSRYDSNLTSYYPAVDKIRLYGVINVNYNIVGIPSKFQKFRSTTTLHSINVPPRRLAHQLRRYLINPD